MKQHSSGAEIFLEISIHLTGFNRVDLLGTGMLDTYYNKTLESYVEADEGATLQSFLMESEKIIHARGANDESIQNAIATNLVPYVKFNLLISQIITLWYMGNWGNDVVSPVSYTQGLIWNIADAHPPGAKQPGYGSWAIPPFNLNQEIT